MTISSSIRSPLPSADRDHPLVGWSAVVVGAVSAAGLYLLVTAWVLPGVADIVAALPVGVRLGVLLLASTATRLAAGWLAARRYRARNGLPERTLAIPSAALGGFLGFALVALLAALGSPRAGLLEVLVDAVRWPLECAVGALFAFPGGSDADGTRPARGAHNVRISR